MSDPDHKIVRAPEQHDLPERVHPLVAAAMATGTLDPATLRELLQVQREWEAGEARKAYARALVGLKRDLPTVIGRDRTVDFTSAKGRTHYTHTSLAAAMAAVTEPLTAHGFSLAWTPQTANNAVNVTCRLTHSEGHFEECTISAPPDVSGNKNPAQAIASTITLLQRYTALALLGIATADMVDPQPEPPAPDAVDAARNLRAAARLAKMGLARSDAESMVGRPVAAWTSDDIDRIATWARGEVPAPEPGSDG